MNDDNILRWEDADGMRCPACRRYDLESLRRIDQLEPELWICASCGGSFSLAQIAEANGRDIDAITVEGKDK